MKLTTTRLTLPCRRTWYDLPVPATIVICVFSLIAIAFLVGKLRSAPAAVTVPTPALMILIATSAPTAEPAPPTPDQQVYQELAALRARVAELEQQAAAPPQVVYQPVYVEQPAYAAPTPAPELYAVASEPLPTMPPQQMVILDRQQWALDAQQAGR
jgi:hypothetical protein